MSEVATEYERAHPLVAAVEPGIRIFRVATLAARAASAGALATVVALIVREAARVGSELADEPLLAWARLVATLAAGVVVSVIDVRERRIPNVVTYPVLAAVFASAFVESLWRACESTFPPAPDVWSAAVTSALGTLALASPFFALAWFGTLGFGDVKLAAVLGAGLLPVTGWGGLAIAFGAAYLLALPHALVALIRRTRGGADTELPFGPYLVAGAIVAVAWHVLGG